MRLLVVGGKLQGTEAAYLAAEAGYEVVLADRRERVPAAGLAGEVHALDVTADAAQTRELVRSCDAVLPACEDDATLAWLAGHVPAWDVPLLFDLRAYAVTSSKLRSGELFERLDVPRPLPWPRCAYPVVVKPSVGSGSHGVRLVADEPQLALARAEFAAAGEEMVAEEYLDGPALSYEVLGWGHDAVVLQATGLEFDAVYDCKRVTAPVEPGGEVTAAILDEFAAVSRRLAQGIELRGVMDVEVTVSAGRPKVLEIDARLPSQTPAAVLHSSGLNLVSLLYETVDRGALPALVVAAAPGSGTGIDVDAGFREGTRRPSGSVYQHVRVADGQVEVRGEHIVAAAGPLRRHDGLWGADVVLTDRDDPARGDDDPWVAIMMVRGDDLAAARERAAAAVAALAGEHGLEIAPEGAPARADGGGRRA